MSAARDVVLVGLDSTVAPQVLRVLHEHRYHVELAADGSEALEQALAERPCLFILNEVLASIDELDFLARLRTDPQLAGIPVLTIVRERRAQRRPQAAKPGRKTGLGAPFSDDELLQTIDRTLAAANDEVHDALDAGQASVAAISRLQPLPAFVAQAAEDLAQAVRPGRRGTGCLATIRLDELLRLNRHGNPVLMRDLAEQVAELAAHDASAFERVALGDDGHIHLALPELSAASARARLRVLAQRIARHRFHLGSQLVELTPAIGYARLIGAVDPADLLRRAADALEVSAAHLDLEPILYQEHAPPRRRHEGAEPHAPSWLRRFGNRHRLALQFVATMLAGLVLPYWLYRGLAAAGLDISQAVYYAVVAILSLTVVLIWWECVLALREEDPPETPARPYPPASAIIAAYLPNEAEILLPTIRAFLAQQYPNSLQVILAYNTPQDMAFEQTLRELAELDSRFIPLRVVGSTSKAQNINVALARVTGEFTGIFDADHQPDPDSFRRAWRWLSHGADVVQGHCLIRNGDASWVAKMVAVEFEQIYAVSHPGRTRLHGFGLFGGSNGYWKTRLIRQMRMQGFMLTEDIDSSMRAVITGHTIVSDPKLVSRELAPETLPALMKQRLRWAQGWLQISLKWIVPALRSPHLTLRQKLGMFHLLAWREAYAWISLQIFPLIAFWAHQAGGLARLDWFRPLFWTLTLVTLATGPGQLLFTWILAERQVRRRGAWFWFYLVASIAFYSEFKNIIARIAHLKEAMKEKAWVVTRRSAKPGK